MIDIGVKVSYQRLKPLACPLRRGNARADYPTGGKIENAEK